MDESNGGCRGGVGEEGKDVNRGGWVVCAKLLLREDVEGCPKKNSYFWGGRN